MRAIVLLGVLSIGLTAIPSAAACEPTTSDPEVDTCDIADSGTGIHELGVGGDCYYIDNDPCQPGCTISLWIYPESNGREGLQRGDDSHDDTCGGEIEPDAWAGL